MTIKKNIRRQGDFSAQSRTASLKISKKGKTFTPGKLANLKNFLIIFFIFIFFGGLLAGVASVSIWLYGKAITSDFFTTRHIDVAGNTRLTRDMVLQYGGISQGDNSLSVSIADIERKLRETPWVKEASVKRLLPDRFVIKIHERMPTFWVRKENSIYYANERGEIIAPVESKNFLSLPTLTILPGAEQAVDCLARLMTDIKNGALPIESGAISAITLSNANGVEIFLEDRELKLSIAIDDWDGNLSRMGVALSDLARRRELGFAREIRAMDGNVWVLRNPSQSS